MTVDSEEIDPEEQLWAVNEPELKQPPPHPPRMAQPRGISPLEKLLLMVAITHNFGGVYRAPFLPAEDLKPFPPSPDDLERSFARLAKPPKLTPKIEIEEMSIAKQRKAKALERKKANKNRRKVKR